MALTSTDQHLLRLSKATTSLNKNFDEAVYIATATGRTFDDLRDQVCADRLRLAAHFVTSGDRVLTLTPSQNRTAISRYYYGMYHTMRSVVYFVEKGDDHQEHSSLPKKTPPDFKDSALWINALKDARGRRNEADYDPYPLRAIHFRSTAIQLGAQAHDLLAIAKSYLKSKGCGHI